MPDTLHYAPLIALLDTCDWTTIAPNYPLGRRQLLTTDDINAVNCPHCVNALGHALAIFVRNKASERAPRN